MELLKIFARQLIFWVQIGYLFRLWHQQAEAPAVGLFGRFLVRLHTILSGTFLNRPLELGGAVSAACQRRRRAGHGTFFTHKKGTSPKIGGAKAGHQA